ncbi:MAG: hypothetical protein KKC46_03360 [Proteobacteria bacterium]|nr:hypothetical protein [Pseudomonadota bacterium]
MIEAISFQHILNIVNDDLKKASMRITFYDSVDPVSRNAMAEINKKVKRHNFIGVIFCNPNTIFCKNEILLNLNYFHHRSGKHINFFCCGYGNFWPEGLYQDQQVVASIDGMAWYYSDQAFVYVLNEFEKTTTWRYSGENELLLLDVSPPIDDKLNINSAIVCNLEIMNRDKAFTSVRSFFEDIIRYSATNENANGWQFSDRKGGEAAKNYLKEAILSLLPKTLQDTYKKAENYAVRQI